MGRKSISITYDNPPETLENNPFFGLKLDVSKRRLEMLFGTKINL